MEMWKLKHQKRAAAGQSLRDRMKAFVKEFYRKQDGRAAVGPREAEDAPVLKPRKGFRYNFSA